MAAAQKDGSAAERIKTNPRGFLSKDNAKRDEFSNVTRTAQWRENLGKEIRFTQKGAAAFYKNLPQPTKEDKRMKMLMRRSMSSSSVIGKCAVLLYLDQHCGYLGIGGCALCLTVAAAFSWLVR